MREDTRTLKTALNVVGASRHGKLSVTTNRYTNGMPREVVAVVDMLTSKQINELLDINSKFRIHDIINPHYQVTVIKYN